MAPGVKMARVNCNNFLDIFNRKYYNNVSNNY